MHPKINKLVIHQTKKKRVFFLLLSVAMKIKLWNRIEGCTSLLINISLIINFKENEQERSTSNSNSKDRERREPRFTSPVTIRNGLFRHRRRGIHGAAIGSTPGAADSRTLRPPVRPDSGGRREQDQASLSYPPSLRLWPPLFRRKLCPRARRQSSAGPLSRNFDGFLCEIFLCLCLSHWIVVLSWFI